MKSLVNARFLHFLLFVGLVAAALPLIAQEEDVASPASPDAHLMG